MKIRKVISLNLNDVFPYFAYVQVLQKNLLEVARVMEKKVLYNRYAHDFPRFPRYTRIIVVRVHFRNLMKMEKSR